MPRPPGSQKLFGEDAYRIRQGDYRILYTIDDEKRLVEVYKIGHRREVYR
jgi:mRNA interferase RelE/StbE